MQAFYFYIVIIGVCAFLAHTASENFRGSSMKGKNFLTIMALLGYISFIAILITSFFFIIWWHTILLFVSHRIIAGFLNPIGRNPFVGLFACLCIVVFSLLAWIGML